GEICSWRVIWSSVRRWSIAMITRITSVTIWCISYSYYLVQIIWGYCFTTGYVLISVVSRNYWSIDITKGMAFHIPRSYVDNLSSYIVEGNFTSKYEGLLVISRRLITSANVMDSLSTRSLNLIQFSAVWILRTF